MIERMRSLKNLKDVLAQMKKDSKKVGKFIKAVKRTVLGIGPLVPGQLPLEQDVKMLGSLEKFNRHRLDHV